MGDADNHWLRAQESNPSVSSPQRHATVALPFHQAEDTMEKKPASCQGATGSASEKKY